MSLPMSLSAATKLGLFATVAAASLTLFPSLMPNASAVNPSPPAPSEPLTTQPLLTQPLPAPLLTGAQTEEQQDSKQTSDSSEGKKMAIATFGGGCFWCVEAAFEQLQGVGEVVSGYEGGHVENPTYEQVCGKKTGHIEVCQIHFDPSVISFDELLTVFFKVHDPTSRDRQGADAGPQYRSVIFFHDEEQQRIAKEHIKKVDESRKLGRKIVTDVRPTEKFYVAEEYHQDYFAKNPFAGYCQAVVRPKVQKVQEEFGDKLKK